jgi:hypothetical protein
MELPPERIIFIFTGDAPLSNKTDIYAVFVIKQVNTRFTAKPIAAACKITKND